MQKMNYDGKVWKVVSDHTTATLSATHINKGVARTELIVKEGSPEEIKKLLEGKKHKILYSWNVKTLVRETLNAGGLIKHRETCLLQAEGIDGEGKKFSEGDADEVGDEGSQIVERPVDKVKRQFKDCKAVTIALIMAVIALFIFIGVEIANLVRQ